MKFAGLEHQQKHQIRKLPTHQVDRALVQAVVSPHSPLVHQVRFAVFIRRGWAPRLLLLRSVGPALGPPAPTLTGPRRAARPPGPACPQTAREARFLQTYGAAVLSVHRSGESVTGDVADIKLQAGDVLVLETGPEFAKVFSHSPAFALISKVRRRRCCPGGARGRAHAHWPLLRARCKGGCTHRPWDPRVWLWRERLEGRGARRSQTRPLAWPGP
jgi:hypothetical protein